MVWHCEECRKLDCAWIDLDTKKYKELISPNATRIVQARNILFDQRAMVVFINPIDDDERGNCKVVTERVFIVPPLTETVE